MKQYCQVNEIVLAVDNNHLYEAKILRADFVGSWKYFIHYQSWHRKYDCWVDEQMIAKKDDLAKQARIGGVDATTSNGSSKKSKKSVDVKVEKVTESVNVSVADDTPIATRSGHLVAPNKVDEEPAQSSGKRKVVETIDQENLRKHRKRLLLMDMVDEDDEVFLAKLPLPNLLKKHLIEEHTLLTTPDAPARLLELPKRKDHTVESIAKEFMESKSKALEKDKIQIHSYQGLVDGLVLHFDKALPSILLYRQERAQYDALVEAHPTLPPSQIYGAEHLLRLFVRMPRLLGNVCLPPAEVNQILSKLSELIKHVNKNASQYLDPVKYVLVEGEVSVEPVLIAEEE